MRIMLVLAVAITMNPFLLRAQTVGPADAGCSRWYARIVHADQNGNKSSDTKNGDLTEKVLQMNASSESDPDGVKALSERESLAAIECLLKMEGNTNPASIGALTRLDISQLFAPAPANLDALYYISYLYSGNWKHAAAVALRGPGCNEERNGLYVTRERCIRQAYAAYRAWFTKVRSMGLGGARQAGLQPLDGTGLRWY